MPKPDYTQVYKANFALTLGFIAAATAILMASTLGVLLLNHICIHMFGFELFSPDEYFGLVKTLFTITCVVLYAPLITIAAGYYHKYKKSLKEEHDKT